VPSASPQLTRLAVIAIAGLLLVGGVAGCSTTQEKAEIKQAQSEHILEARAKRQQQRKESKHDNPGKKDDKGSNQQ
jgi:hypothetical protein